MKLMRWLISVLVCALCVTGCSLFKSKKHGADAPKGAAKAPKSAKPDQKAIVTPVAGLSGRVAAVNTAGQFVVITFEAGTTPAPDQKLSLYRSSLKVGEVKVSREQMGKNIVADLVAGEAKVGDEARAAEETK